MDILRIKGGRPLYGQVVVQGAKNSALPCMTAALLTDQPVTLMNVPQVQDVFTMSSLLRHLGAGVTSVPDGRVSLDCSQVNVCESPYDLVRKMRASVLTLGPLLARKGHAELSLPGGCAIGTRPIDLHLSALEKMGAVITIEHGYVYAKTSGLKGCELYFDTRTVTGTENVMMAAALADGVTVLRNCACEPEVQDLAAMLNGMGAHIAGVGTDTVEIQGVASLNTVTHRIVSDRIVAGTYLVAVALAHGDIWVRNVIPVHLSSLIEKLRNAGIRIEIRRDADDRGVGVAGSIRVSYDGARLEPQEITTLPYPGFPTDLQAQFMALMTQAEGSSIIEETIFENRFMHAAELQRMGADIRAEGSRAVVMGKTSLSGAHVMATDLRASASLVLAALAAEGETVVHRVYHLDRGYPQLDEALRLLGADVVRDHE